MEGAIMINGYTKYEYSDFAYFREDTNVLHLGIDISGKGDSRIWAPTDIIIEYLFSGTVSQSTAGPAFIHARTVKKYPVYKRHWNREKNQYEYVYVEDRQALLRFLHLSPKSTLKLSIGDIIKKGTYFLNYANENEILQWYKKRGIKISSERPPMNPHLHFEVLNGKHPGAFQYDNKAPDYKKRFIEWGAMYYCDPIVWFESAILTFNKNMRQSNLTENSSLEWNAKRIIDISRV